MRALVTGGAGFIGSTLVDRLLQAGHRVSVVDDLSAGSIDNLQSAAADFSDSFEFHRLDIRTPDAHGVVVEFRPDVMFHLAANMDVRVSVERPGYDADVNVLGGLNMLEAARIAGTKTIVFASSGGTIYGDLENGSYPAIEDGPQLPMSPYGVTKKMFADYLRTYESLYDLKYVALALGNVFGPRQNPHGEAGVVSIFGERLLSGRPCRIFGDGLTTRDYVYVDDVVEAFRLAVDSPSGLYNIANGEEKSVRDVFDAMADACGVAAEPEYAPSRLGELRRVWLDIDKARSQLGWKPQVDFADGCRRTAEFIRGQALLGTESLVLEASE